MESGTTRAPLAGLPALASGRIVAVLRSDAPQRLASVVETLVDSGIRCIELTMTTPGAIDALSGLAHEFGESAEIGMGTLTRVDEVRAAAAAGGAFAVTPAVLPRVVEACRELGLPVVPGALTPTEIAAAWAAGPIAVKLFPASTVGIGYLRSLRGPFPAIPVMPSGGVGIEDIPDWFRAGAVAVSLGGELLGDALAGGDLQRLGQRARACRDLVDTVVHEAAA